MVDLPHRFVPTTSKFVSPVRIVSQFGHGAAVTRVSFSPCLRYFASLDASGWLRIWVLETLDILVINLPLIVKLGIEAIAQRVAYAQAVLPK